jgi:hypothetical protein
MDNYWPVEVMTMSLTVGSECECCLGSSISDVIAIATESDNLCCKTGREYPAECLNGRRGITLRQSR